jgi:hypothetical protein
MPSAREGMFFGSLPNDELSEKIYLIQEVEK